MKNILYTALLILLSGSIFSQLNDINKVNEFLDRKGEVYFSFTAHSKDVINEISEVISVDNVIPQNGYYKVTAYANKDSFNKFLKYNIDYIVLPHPGDQDVDSFWNSRELYEWNAYPTYNLYISMMNQFQAAYPNLCHIYTIGNSVQNKPILVAKITDSVNVRKNKPRVLLTSSMHGDELTGYVLMLRLIDTLLKGHNNIQQITYLMNRVEIWINPLANPDGTYVNNDTTVNNARRYNANNYDLNRNFPDPAAGQYPGGTRQQETQHFINFAQQYVWTLAANFHGGAEVVNIPWDTWSRLHFDNDWWVHISKTYVDTVHSINPTYMDDYLSGNPGIPGITNGYAWYRVTGGRQDFMNYWHGCKEMTIEISQTKKPAGSTLPNFWNYNYRSFFNLIKESLYGVRGIVRDSVTDLPIKANISVDGYDIQDSTWIYSDSIAGDFHRMLKTGTFTLKFSKSGYISKIIPNIYVKYDSTTILYVKLRPVNVGLSQKNETANKFTLHQNYPNPFNPITNISFSIPANSLVKLTIYNILGKEVAIILNEKMNAGIHSIDFDASKLTSGIYFYKLEAGSFSETRKMILIK